MLRKILIISFSFCLTLQSFPQTKADYRMIYNSVTRFYLDSILQNDTTRIFIIDSTIKKSRGTKNKIVYTFLNIKNIYDSNENYLKLNNFNEEFEKQTATSDFLPDILKTYKQTTFFSRDTLNKIFYDWNDSLIALNEDSCCWEKIHIKYRHAGWFSMSRPYLFDNSKKAIIYCGYCFAPLVASTFNMILKKKRNKWLIIDIEFLTIS